MEIKRLRRLVRQALRITAIAAAIALTVQWTLRNWTSNVRFIPSPLDTDIASSAPLPDATVWELVRNDTRVSKFINIVGEFKDIVSGLDAEKASFNFFVPTNEAFEKEYFAWDLPSFYWLYLVGYHMGPGAFSQQDLSSHTATVPSFVFADVFDTYRQRISTQRLGKGQFSLNHRARPAAHEMAAVNGYVHLIDRVLMMPESTSDLLRDDPHLSTMRRALIETDVAVIVNDTSSHVAQTVFALTNAAFDKLGPEANQFLFSPYGKEYLKALVEYHIVANKTMFTNCLFPHNGEAQVPLEDGSEVQLPTLLPAHNLSITVDLHGSRVSPKINDAVRIDQADLVVMDGVVHKIDNVLLPPLLADENGPPTQKFWMDAFLQWLPGSSTLSVGQLKKRLEPLLFVES